MFQEPEETWHKRLGRVRDYLTDFYFAYNLPFSLLEEIVQEAVNENRAGRPEEVVLTFNPELAPWHMLFDQDEKFASYSAQEFERVKHHLREIIVVMLKSLVSDQLAFVHFARDFFNIDDLKEIKARKIGRGKIGGKSAGMLLAHRILSEVAPPEVRAAVRTPVSYFLASDLFYAFMAANGLIHWSDQKYKPEAQMRAEYPRIVEDSWQGNSRRILWNGCAISWRRLRVDHSSFAPLACSRIILGPRLPGSMIVSSAQTKAQRRRISKL